MKKTVLFILCFALAVIPALGYFTLTVYADGSHGTYMDVNTSPVYEKSKAFMIDFYSESDNALCTYWNNAGFSMDTSTSVRKLGYKNITGGGGYAGLQILGTSDNRTGIMSIWRYEYKDKRGNTQYLYADCMYPEGSTHYDNEGSGTSFISQYPWKCNQWYRQLLYSWTDEETGMTFAGTWFYDYVADQWTLLCYYNTKLVDSYFKGGFGQFLENFSESERGQYRHLSYRNIYAQSYNTKKWVSTPTVHFFSDGNVKAVGEVKMGVTEDGSTVWASVDGKSSIDSDKQEHIYTTLTQPDTPTYGTPAISDFSVYRRGNDLQVFWEMAENSTPQIAYSVSVTDENGKEIAKASGTRPEIVDCIVNNVETDAFKCTLTVTDVFGQTTSSSYTTSNYKAPSAPAVIPTLVTADLPAGVTVVSKTGKNYGIVGEAFEFTLQIEDGYAAAGALQVEALGNRLIPTDGKYRFTLSREQDNKITVTGVKPSFKGNIDIIGYNGTSNNFEKYSDKFMCILDIKNKGLPADLYDSKLVSGSHYPYTFRLTVDGQKYDMAPTSVYNFVSSTLYRLPVSDGGWFPEEGTTYNVCVEICMNGVPIYKDDSVSLVCNLDAFSENMEYHTHTYEGGETLVVAEGSCSAHGKAIRFCTVDGCRAVEEISLPINPEAHIINTVGSVTKLAQTHTPGEKSAVCDACGQTVTAVFYAARYDANGDDVIDISDVTALLDYLAMKAESIACIDNTGDGYSNIKDVTALLLYLSKQ